MYGPCVACQPPRWRTGASKAFLPASYTPNCETQEAGVPVVCVLEAPMRHVAGTCEAGRQHAGGALAWAEPLPGTHLYVFFDKRKNLGWKIVINIHGRKHGSFFVGLQVPIRGDQ